MRHYDPQSGRDVPADATLSQAQFESDDDDVVGALAQLAELAADVGDLEGVLEQIAGFAVTAVPGADGAGVTLLRLSDSGQATVLAWAATAPFVREIDRLQYEVCGEGPCLTAMHTRRALISGSLGSDERWPRFGGRVARMSTHSAMALPLEVRDRVVGAINVYAHPRDVFSEHAVRVGERFATPAAVSVHNASLLNAARERTAHLQRALTTRAVIDQAIGILRGRTGCGADEALERLRRLSQTENTRLSVVAERLIDEAVRRARSRREDSSVDSG